MCVHIHTCTNNNGRVFKGGNKILFNYMGYREEDFIVRGSYVPHNIHTENRHVD